MSIFSPISGFVKKLTTKKTATTTRRKRQDATRSANSFGLVPMSAGPYCYDCHTYHWGGWRNCPANRYATTDGSDYNPIRDDREMQNAQENPERYGVEIIDPTEFAPTDTDRILNTIDPDEWAPEIDDHDEPRIPESVLMLPLRPSGPWNKKLACGHIIRDKCACYRDS